MDIFEQDVEDHILVFVTHEHDVLVCLEWGDEIPPQERVHLTQILPCIDIPIDGTQREIIEELPIPSLKGFQVLVGIPIVQKTIGWIDLSTLGDMVRSVPIHDLGRNDHIIHVHQFIVCEVIDHVQQEVIIVNSIQHNSFSFWKCIKVQTGECPPQSCLYLFY